MPYQSQSQITGDQGERWFLAQLPDAWVAQKQTPDVGIDFIVVVCEPGPLNGREFRVQVKSSKRFAIRKGQVVVPKIKRSTLEYWFRSAVPTMLVAFDTGTKRGYFRWHNELGGLLSDLKERTTVSVSIPAKGLLSAQSWADGRERLKWHYANLGEALRDARDARSVLPTIHRLAGAARMLSSIDHQKIPVAQRTSQQDGILALLELFQHREVTEALSTLRDELLPASCGARELDTWVASYRSTVLSAFPCFDAFPSGDTVSPDFQIAYSRELADDSRAHLIEAALEMVMRLAPRETEDV